MRPGPTVDGWRGAVAIDEESKPFDVAFVRRP